ncbi:MAG: hypothetical protein ABIE55_02915 [Candidatus Aenigmatarchaeota archaeon]
MRRYMTKEDVVEKTNENVDLFFFDLNNSTVKRNRVRNFHSFKEFFKNTTRPPIYKNLKMGKIYFSENLKDWRSDDKIGSFMPAACHVFLFDVTKEDFYEAGTDYCKNNEIPYIKRFQNNVRNLNIETILITRHVFPEPYVKYFEFGDKVSNYTKFDSKGRFKRFDIPIRTGEDKLKAAKLKVREKNLTLDRCAAMVDGINDIPLVEALTEEGGLTLASPLAKPELAKKVDYHIKSFEDLGVLARMLEKEMPQFKPLSI